MTRNQAVRKINQAICGISKGIFIDDYWQGVKVVQDKLNAVAEKLEVECLLNNATYEGEAGVDHPMHTRKRWVYLVGNFKNPIVVIILACGAGTEDDPLSKYDVVSYAS